MKMIGRKNYPFCGRRCCYEYASGGKSHKRIIKKVEKQREETSWRKEVQDEQQDEYLESEWSDPE